MGVLSWGGLVSPNFQRPLAAKLCVRPPNVFEVQECARGPLSPCQVWWGSDFTRCRGGQKMLRCFCLSWLPVNSSHGNLVTWSCRHMVNSSPVNSSQKHLITQSTRHKRAHNKTASTSRNYLHAVSLRRHPETVLNTDGVITTICVTLMYTADSGSRRQITLLRKARSTRHNAVKHDGQLVTWFYDVTSWLCRSY